MLKFICDVQRYWGHVRFFTIIGTSIGTSTNTSKLISGNTRSQGLSCTCSHKLGLIWDIKAWFSSYNIEIDGKSTITITITTLFFFLFFGSNLSCGLNPLLIKCYNNNKNANIIIFSFHWWTCSLKKPKDIYKIWRWKLKLTFACMGMVGRDIQILLFDCRAESCSKSIGDWRPSPSLNSVKLLYCPMNFENKFILILINHNDICLTFQSF